MALEFSSTSAPLSDVGAKILVYSPSGGGKTVLARTMPGKKIIIGAERGELSLAPANQMRIFGNVEDIPIIRINSPEDLREAYALITSAAGQQFDSLCLDSISEIAEKVLSTELSRNKDGRKAFGNMQETMSTYIRLFRDLPRRHVYFTAKQDRQVDADGAILYQPSMPGKTMTQDLPHFFDEVFALYVTPKDANGKSHRVLKTRIDSQFYAKDRSGALDEFEEPNLAKIIAKIKQP